METFVITFAGEGIRDGWLLVHAHDEQIARAWAAKEYGRCWSGIHPHLGFWLQDTYKKFALGQLGETTLYYEKASHIRGSDPQHDRGEDQPEHAGGPDQGESEQPEDPREHEPDQPQNGEGQDGRSGGS